MSEQQREPGSDEQMTAEQRAQLESIRREQAAAVSDEEGRTEHQPADGPG